MLQLLMKTVMESIRSKITLIIVLLEVTKSSVSHNDDNGDAATYDG